MVSGVPSYGFLGLCLNLDPGSHRTSSSCSSSISSWSINGYLGKVSCGKLYVTHTRKLSEIGSYPPIKLRIAPKPRAGIADSLYLPLQTLHKSIYYIPDKFSMWSVTHLKGKKVPEEVDMARREGLLLSRHVPVPRLSQRASPAIEPAASVTPNVLSAPTSSTASEDSEKGEELMNI